MNLRKLYFVLLVGYLVTLGLLVSAARLDVRRNVASPCLPLIMGAYVTVAYCALVLRLQRVNRPREKP
jgi:hypothetical protein